MKIEINTEYLPKLKNKDNISSIINYLVQIGYNHVFLNEQKSLSDNICNNIKEDLLISNTKLDDLDNIIKKLFGLSSSSNKKGELSENLIYEYINNNHKNYCYDKTRSIPHYADGLLTSSDGLKCLVEIKNYDNTVNKDELIKFKNDLQNNNIRFGIFISIKSNIIGKNYFDHENYLHNEEQYNIIYISKFYENENLLDGALIILEKLNSIMKKNNIRTNIHCNLETHFEELNEIINKTNILNDKYLNLEKIIKNSFDNFYTDFRLFSIELNKQIKTIWSNIENDIEIKYVDSKDSKQEILNNYSNDKCIIILSKLFDKLQSYKINESDGYINILKNNIIVGKIKKLKEKLILEFNDSIKITLNKKNIDKNLELISQLLNS